VYCAGYRGVVVYLVLGVCSVQWCAGGVVCVYCAEYRGVVVYLVLGVCRVQLCGGVCEYYAVV